MSSSRRLKRVAVAYASVETILALVALIAPGQSGWLVAAWIAPAPLSILLLPMLSVLLSVLGIIAEPVAWVAWVPTMAAIAAAQVVLAARLLDAMKRGSCWWRMRRFCIRKA